MALRQGSVPQIRKGQLTKQHGHLVIAMCFYPRGLKKELRDEYRADLAPDRILFKEFKEFQKRFGHEAGFIQSHYEKRFSLSPNALEHLKELSELSKIKDVYLVCQCTIGERCHREMLLLTAEKLYGAAIGQVFQEYSVHLNRLEKMIV